MPDKLESGRYLSASRLAAAQRMAALNGDADRVMFVDEKGRIVDGDQIMA